MNKIIRNILLINIGILLITGVCLSEGKLSDFMEIVAFIGFFLSPINFILAFFSFLINIRKPGTSKYTLGFALSGAATGLASFTLCSTGHGLKI